MGYNNKNYDDNKYVESLIAQREKTLNESFKKAKSYLTNQFFFEKDLEAKIAYLNSKDGLLLIEGMSSDKLSFVRISDCLEINQKDLHAVVRENSNIYDALDRGRSKSLDKVEESLNKMANGYFVTETRTKVFANERNDKESSQTEKYERWIPGNAYAATYILNNKRQDEWRDKQLEFEMAKNTIKLEIEIIGDDSLDLS